MARLVWLDDDGLIGGLPRAVSSCQSHALSLGFTRLMARGQEPRLALGLSSRI